jgi:Fe-S cluster biogenesis protein NfuA
MSIAAAQRIEELLDELDSVPDGPARTTATALVQALLDVYGEGLARLVGHVAEHDDGTLAEALARDEHVAPLLILHGLHPVPLEERVRAGLDEVRPYLEQHGGNVELLGIEEGVVRLQLQGSCSGCPSSAITLKLAVEEAVHKAAPDVAGIVAEDAPAAPGEPALIQLEVYEACPAPLHR